MSTDIPEDREHVQAKGVAAVVEAIEAGKVVWAGNPLGVPHVWKADEGVYRGTLLRYRVVTDNPTFTTATEAAEWFEDCYHETYG